MRGAVAALAVVASLAASAVWAQPVTEPALTEIMRRRGADFTQTLAELETLSNAGSAGATAILAGYRSLAARDFPAACRSWESAAAVSAEAAHLTAECYEHGHGGTTDLDRAISLYTQAGDAGFGKSLCALGNLHVSGEGVEQDLTRAIELCRRGAELGDPDAQTDLGNFHLRGQGVAQDIVEARRWYQLAVDGYAQPNAAFVLGQIYWNGDGVEQDRGLAARYWRMAYEGGRKDAAFLLAGEAISRARVEDGFDVEPLREAEQWLVLVEPDDPNAGEAAELLEAVRSLLSRAGT